MLLHGLDYKNHKRGGGGGGGAGVGRGVTAVKNIIDKNHRNEYNILKEKFKKHTKTYSFETVR